VSVTDRLVGTILRVRVRELTPALRIAIVVLALAVLICVALPMSNADSAMSFGVMCCFVLAVLLSAFLLDGSQRTPWLAVARVAVPPLPPSILATARAPDLVALGSLLI